MNKQVTKRQIPYDSTCMKYSRVIKTMDLVLARGSGKRDMEFLFSRNRVLLEI